MVYLYFIIGAFLRRWFGGLFPENKYKVLGNRGLQSIVMISVFLSIYIKWSDIESVLLALIISLWLQFQFWSRGHGCCFDLGNDTNPSEDTIRRYNERWYHVPCDWLVKQGFFSYYSPSYDYVYMTLRYTCPMLPLIFWNWHYILIGLAAAPIYLICWSLYKSNLNPAKLPYCINSPTKWAEIFYGGLVYSSCYLLGL